MNCQEIVKQLYEIQNKKIILDGLINHRSVTEAPNIRLNLSAIIRETKEESGFIFIEGKSHRTFSLEIGGKSNDELINELKAGNVSMDSNMEREISHNLETSKSPKRVKLVRLSSKDMGFDEQVGYVNLWGQILRLGLGECPDEVAVYQRLKDSGQKDDHYMVAVSYFGGRSGSGGNWIYSVENKNGRRSLDRSHCFVRSYDPGTEWIVQVPDKDQKKK